MKIIKIILTAGIIMATLGSYCSKNNDYGGWVDLDTKSISAKEAYLFLHKELQTRHPDIRLQKIVKAETQAVAGYNVALVCLYTGEKEESPKKLSAQIYVDLKNRYQLTELKLDIK